MARINIEDSLFKDARFFALAMQLGSKTNALGALAEAWIVAQGFWVNNSNGIPRDVWQQQKLHDAIISCGLAIDQGDFIYMRGSEKQFSWLRQRQSAGKMGGIASGKARVEIIEEKTKRNEAERSGAKPLTLTLTLKKEKEENTRARVSEAISEWQTTLDHYKIKRNAAVDEVLITRLLIRYSHEDVLAALRGFRFEKPGTDYDPAQNVSISRLTKPAAFDRLRNIGAQRTGEVIRSRSSDAIPESE